MARPTSSSASGSASTHSGDGHGRTSVPSLVWTCRGPAEVVVQPDHALAAEDLDAPGRAPAQDVVPDAGELRLETRGEGERDGGQVLDAFVAGVVGRPGGDASRPRRSRSAGCRGRGWSARSGSRRRPGRRRPATATRRCPESGSTGRRGRSPPSARPSVAACDEVAQGPEDRRAAQHEPALAGHARRRSTASTSAVAPGQVAVERLLAEDGAAGGEGLVDGAAVRRGRRADPDGVAAARRPLRRSATATAAPGEPTASAKPWARRSRGSWTATIAASSTPPSIIALRPSPWAHAIEPRPDEADAHHGAGH